MKKIFFLIAVTFALISCSEKAKDSFTIHGNIEGLSTGMVYLGYAQGDDYITDSAVVKDGEFTLEGKVEEPVIGYLQVTDSKGLNLVVENADIEISGNAASPDDIQIKGGKVQQEFDAYQASTKDLRDAQKPITEALMKARETGDEAAFNEQMAKGRELDKKMIEANRKYIQEHPASYVSLHLLYMMSEGLELEELEEMYGGMDASYQNSMAGKSIASRIKAIKNTSVGATAMDFAQTDTEGNTVKLSDLRGKYVLLDGGLLSFEHVTYSLVSTDSSINIFAANSSGSKPKFHIALSINYTGGPGVYEMKVYPYRGEFMETSDGTIPGGSTNFSTSDVYIGTVTIKYFNGSYIPYSSGTILSGTFEMDAINNEGKVIHITEGRFDIGQ